MEPTLGLAISGTISISTLLYVAYFAGKFTEKISKLEIAFEETHEELKKIRQEIHNVQLELGRLASNQQFANERNERNERKLQVPRGGLHGSQLNPNAT